MASEDRIERCFFVVGDRPRCVLARGHVGQCSAEAPSSNLRTMTKEQAVQRLRSALKQSASEDISISRGGIENIIGLLQDETGGEVTIVTNEAGECVAVTRTDAEHKILSIIWERSARSLEERHPDSTGTNAGSNPAERATP